MIDAEGDELQHRARRAPAHEFPLVLLVDGDTASAAELFAACLSAHGRAVVAGAPTRGKDTGQILVRASSGEAVSITAARFIPPGAPLDAAGRVAPHLPASDALAAALEYLNGSP
jgi:carboxyl-terminal processing protease